MITTDFYGPHTVNVARTVNWLEKKFHRMFGNNGDDHINTYIFDLLA